MPTFAFTLRPFTFCLSQPMSTHFTVMPSPLDDLLITANDAGALTRVYFAPFTIDADWREDGLALAPAVAQLNAYFRGERIAFDLPVAPSGTAFQEQVWRELVTIPYGTTITYGALARRVGGVEASRAVGLASGRNPIAIIVPCHRVIGASGALTGYGGGLHRKEWLLRHERARSEPSLF